MSSKYEFPFHFGKNWSPSPRGKFGATGIYGPSMYMVIDKVMVLGPLTPPGYCCSRLTNRVASLICTRSTIKIGLSTWRFFLHGLSTTACSQYLMLP